MSEEPLIAVFVDFENLALGVRHMKAGQFQIQLVLKRLLEKGRIVYKRAYCDWSHYQDAVREFHVQGIELIDIPQSKMSGKNSADIRMVVDALDLCYSKQHIDVFALLSGDSDFSPLVSKLKENNKRRAGLRREKLDLGSADRQLRRVPLLRRSDPGGQENRKPAQPAKRRQAEPKPKPRTKKSRKRSTGCWKSSTRSSRITIPSGARCSSKPSAASFPASTKAITATAAFRNCWKSLEKKGLIALEYDESRGNYKVRRAKA